MTQMYKILALNCLISAYSMSVMYLAGIKQGDWQATIAGLMITVCFFGIAKSTPIQKLAPQRPQARVFNWYLVTSVIGQAGVHVAALSYIRSEAIKYSAELFVFPNSGMKSLILIQSFNPIFLILGSISSV